MKKIDLLLGLLLGLISAFIGTFIFITAFTEYEFMQGVTALRSSGNLGKLLTLGAILNLILFFALLHFKKDLMARGVVLATIILTIISLFI